MEVSRLVTEADINAKLSELKGKVPSVIINDLREKLLSKKDTLTYEQLEKIIQRVIDSYGSQVTKYEQISKRVDELGKRLGELSMQLSRLIESLEEKKFEIHEKKAEKIEEKIEKVKEKLEKVEEKIEETPKEEVPSEIIEELPEKIEELHEKVEEIADKIKEKKEKIAKEVPEEVEKMEKKIEEVEVTPEEVVEVVPEVEELPKEKIEVVEEKPEVVEKVAEEEKEKVEEIVEKPDVVEAHKEEIVEGGVEMAEEKLSLPADISNLLFAEEPKKARLEKIPEDIVSTMIALKWLGFLIDRVGVQNLERILEFYYEIGWISENVLNTLLRYAKGTRPHHRDPEWKPAEKLTIQDHLVSLLFIERLRGLRITRDVLDKLERELKMLEKTLDEFYGV